jgi:Bacterial regulatory proteins, tetR family
MRKGGQTRHAIIRKAAPIFNQKGYEGAALSDLMEATGLEKVRIYRFWQVQLRAEEVVVQRGRTNRLRRGSARPE